MAGAASFLTGLRDESVDYLLAGTSVDLLGQKGSGRSTVLREAEAELVERGWDVVRLRGVATLRDRPLEALAAAGLARRPDPRNESAVSAALAAIERSVADERTVLVVDDVDDLDRASAGAITAAHARRLFPVLTTSRPRPEGALDPYVLPSEVRPGVQLPVPPLSYVEVHELVGQTLPGRIDPAVISRIYGLSGGMPGLAVAIAQTGRHSGRVHQDDGTWTAGSDLWSPGLTRVVRPLLTDLDPAGLEALQTLALAGAVTVPTAVDLAGWDALEDLDSCRLLHFMPRGDDVIVAVYPNLVVEHYRHLPLGARRLRFSERMTRLLDPPGDEDGGGSPTRRPAALAPSLRPASDAVPSSLDLPDPTDLSDPVLNRLLREEWHRRRLLRRREWERDPSPRTAVGYLRVLLVANADPDVMRDVVARTPASGDPAEMAAFHRWHGHVLAHAADDVDAAHALLHRATGEVGPWAGLLRALDDHLTLLFDRVPAPPVRALANDPGWALTRQFTRARYAEALIAAGDTGAARALLVDADWTDPDMVTLREVLTGLARLLDADVEGALDWSTRHLEAARSELDADAIPGHAYVAVSALLLLGRYDEMRGVLGSVLSTGLTSALQRHFTSALLDLAAEVARRDGLAGASTTLSDRARTTATGPCALPLPTSTWLSAPPALAREAVDATDAAWATVLDLFDRGFTVSAALQGARVIEASPDKERLDVLRKSVGPRPAALVSLSVRVAEAAADDDPTAGARLGQELLAAGHVVLGVRAIGATVWRLRGSDRPVDATAVLEEARHALGRAGVDADADALLEPFTPVGALTPRELEVATLVARGLTNGAVATALSISPKTVENHLNRLLRKLGATDRNGVAAALGG